jgi:hypothetical protein
MSNKNKNVKTIADLKDLKNVTKTEVKDQTTVIVDDTIKTGDQPKDETPDPDPLDTTKTGDETGDQKLPDPLDKTTEQLEMDKAAKVIADKLAAEQAETERLAKLNPYQLALESLKEVDVMALRIEQLKLHREAHKVYADYMGKKIEKSQATIKTLAESGDDVESVAILETAVSKMQELVESTGKCDLKEEGTPAEEMPEIVLTSMEAVSKNAKKEISEPAVPVYNALKLYFEKTAEIKTAELMNPNIEKLKSANLAVAEKANWVAIFNAIKAAGMPEADFFSAVAESVTVKTTTTRKPKAEGDVNVELTASGKKKPEEKSWVFSAKGIDYPSTEKHTATLEKILIDNKVAKFEGEKMTWDGSKLNLVKNSLGVNGANTNTADPKTKCRLIKEYSKFEITAKN